jgi:tripartite-type tricarboxylate transporter receptor subunit TctC
VAISRVLPSGAARATASVVVIENRPGGGTVIGSFAPVCYLADQPLLLVVNSTSAYHTLADLLNAARAKPGDLTLAANGPATAYQLAFEMLRRAAKVDMTFIPYPGTAPAVTAVLGDHVTSYLGSYAAVMEQLSGGKLRALAAPSKVRIETLPDVPTVSETGVTDFEAVNWIGVLAPAKTPKETVSRLASWFAAPMDAPEVKAKLVVQGLFPATKCGADFATRLKNEYEAYGRAVHDADIKAE